MQEEITVKKVEEKLELLIAQFKTSLYEKDEIFLKNMKTKSLVGDDITKYKYWEWPQGVGLFGFYKLYETTKNSSYLNLIEEYYDRQFRVGFPSKNVNTTAPMLTLAYLTELIPKTEYRELCINWAEWIMNDFPRTEEGGFQHITSDSVNEQELWDDTLFMTVLFLAKMGVATNNIKWIKEAENQFIIHINYLSEPENGLWYHGWTFRDRNHFAGAFWGRGNSWVTISIPEFLSIAGDYISSKTKDLLIQTLKKQTDSLVKYQDESGMWHTLIDDSESYTEASATAGIGYGMLHSYELGIVGESCLEAAKKALPPILDCIDLNGIVHKVSYGTAMGRESKQFYKDIEIKSMPYGQAMSILFLLEAKKLLLIVSNDL